jgi:hypothetical protein
VFSTLGEEDRYYPYAETRESPMWNVLERSEQVLDTVDAYDFTATMDWLDRVYEDVSIPGGATFARSAQRDTFLGAPRAVYDESQTGETLLLRDSQSYRTPVFAARYELADGRVGTPAELWLDTHDCQRTTCGLDDSEWTTCDAAFETFAEQYTVPVPAWWLRDDGPVETVSPVRIADTSVESTRRIDLDYEYRFGIVPTE